MFFFFLGYTDKTMGNLIIFSTDKNTRPDTVLSWRKLIEAGQKKEKYKLNLVSVRKKRKKRILYKTNGNYIRETHIRVIYTRENKTRLM